MCWEEDREIEEGRRVANSLLFLFFSLVSVMLLFQLLGEIVTDGDFGVGMELIEVWCVVLEVRKERGNKNKGSVTFSDFLVYFSFFFCHVFSLCFGSCV